MLLYNYDLVSGKVNGVAYQPGQTDAFYHRYSYDGENRLTDVWTSPDERVWERDARYSYYRHGPLARTELGQERVQGIDYVYTLQGWLKGVNPGGMGGAVSGEEALPVGRDAYGFSLNYRGNDYTAISTIAPGFASGVHNLSNTDNQKVAAPLYNGNIASMAVSIPKLGGANLYGYKYDQLNRIVGMDAFDLTHSGGSWNTTAKGDYKERVSYDPNGNIVSYLRNGVGSTGLPMDNLSYGYNKDGVGKLTNNRLRHVKDAVGNAAYTEDIDNQGDDNYGYDQIGNLIKDSTEGITSIEWTVYGKIEKITKQNGTTISYTYDASGNRITKAVGSKTTVYVRDASGNVMSVYEKEPGVGLKQTEVHLYGSSRLGLWRTDRNVQTPPANPAKVYTFERGAKFFELTNHLGNVLVTVSDRKLQQTSDNSTVSHYTADVASATDYFPFGMSMPGRKYSSERYRYGFNGKENDAETGTQDYGFRIYNPALGKFLSVDPLSMSFPWYTPYQFAGNKPIWATDLDGLEENTTSTHVRKPIVIFKPLSFTGLITVTDATSQIAHRVFTGNFSQLSLRGGQASTSLVYQLTRQKRGTSESRLDITMTGQRTELSKSWRGTDNKYFIQYSYSFTDNGFTEVGTFEMMAVQKPMSARLWDPAVFLMVNRLVTSLFSSANEEINYLFRGTTEGFQGSSATQRLGITPTSTDPGIATIFSIAASKNGKGILQVALPRNLGNVTYDANGLAALELEVGVGMSPSQFANSASLTISTKQAVGILNKMGIKLPSNISLGNISEVIRSTPRMSQSQIDFVAWLR